jgi:ankyrin repeat protein
MVVSDWGYTALLELSVVSVPPDQHAEQLDLARTLIHMGVPVDAQLTGARSTALIMAAVRGDKEFVQLLLKNGADARLQNSRGETASSWAQRKGYADIVALLSPPPPASASASSPQ